LITFYSTERGIGGVENLIINLSIYFAKREIDVKIFNYCDSYIYRRIQEEKQHVTFYDIDEIGENIQNFINPEDILFIFWLNLRNLPKFKNNPKIIFWVVFVYSFSLLNKIRNINFKFLTVSLFKYLESNNSIYFMDGDCVDSTAKDLKIHINSPKYLPIPIIPVERNSFGNNYIKTSHEPFSITYIGRNVIWKVKPIKKVIEDIQKLNLDRKITIIILTNNDTLFKSEIDPILKINNNHLNVKYVLDIGYPFLDDYLLKNSDLHISMGTACLDGAKLGIPSILIDMSYNDFPDQYKYRWIYESKNYILGQDISNTSSFENGHSLKEIFKVLEIPDHTLQISNQCFDYVNKYHNINNVAINVLDACRNSNARINFFLSRTLRNMIIIRNFIKVFSKS
jgi:hypothetical protein